MKFLALSVACLHNWACLGALWFAHGAGEVGCNVEPRMNPTKSPGALNRISARSVEILTGTSTQRSGIVAKWSVHWWDPVPSQLVAKSASFCKLLRRPYSGDAGNKHLYRYWSRTVMMRAGHIGDEYQETVSYPNTDVRHRLDDGSAFQQTSKRQLPWMGVLGSPPIKQEGCQMWELHKKRETLGL